MLFTRHVSGSSPLRLNPSGSDEGASPGIHPSGMHRRVSLTLLQPSAVYDGRWANNAWLQELLTRSPRSPGTIGADQRAVGAFKGLTTAICPSSGDGREMTIPPGLYHARRSQRHPGVGYGRTHAGRVGNGVGFDVGKVRSFAGMGSSADSICAMPATSHYRLRAGV